MDFNIDILNQLIERQQYFKELILSINDSRKHYQKVMVIDAAKPSLISSLIYKTKKPVFLITSTPEKAKILFDQVTKWNHVIDANILPEPDVIPYQKGTADPVITHDRLKILDNLLNRESDDNTPVLISSIHSAIQRVIDAREYIVNSYRLKTGQKIDLLELTDMCQSIGYNIADIVENTGFISRRGGIFDIFPPSSERPIRIEFFGDEIESIRVFDPDTQRSLENLKAVSYTHLTLPTKRIV